MLVQVHGLHKSYQLARESVFSAPPRIEALRGVDLEVHAGRSVGVVGESGCGKSTLARAVMALERPTSGTVKVRGECVSALGEAALRPLRRHFQMVFQDPFASLDPRHRVGRIVAEPLRLTGVERGDATEQAAVALVAVGLRADDMGRYPHEFSGGQRQRIAIARALVTRPALIVADEPVSALDVSVQAQVLNLLGDLGDSHGVTYLLISHDFAIIECLCDEVVVMQAGKVVEHGQTADVFTSPKHSYTRTLLDAVPRVPG